jgi:short-subunit dehydrogenase
MVQDLTGKWILVTGAASGIGRETCLLLAMEGANLVLADLDESGMASLADEVKRHGCECHYMVTDVTDKARVQALADMVQEKVGYLDVLVNNAGIGCSAELRSTTEEQWERLFNINFFSVLKMIDAFLPGMLRRRSGQIVNISTGQVFYPVPTWGAYAASKAALATYSECLTWELRRFGVRVTTVFPGLIKTPFYSKVEARTPAQKFVLWWINALGATPDKMAMKIVEGIRKKKARVIQSWINWMNYLLRRQSPHAFDFAGQTFARTLGEKCEY